MVTMLDIRDTLPVNFPEMIINKSSGLTDAELYLSKICGETFLSLWSYPNIFRDQGRTTSRRKKAKGDGKELCDLLVVFDNHVVIFSDKNCKFKSTGDMQIDWSRWYRKAVLDAAEQIWGAERWIKKHPDNLFLDKGCSEPFPISIPTRDKVIFHRVVVTHGISEICKSYFTGGSGSLIINSQIIGDMHYSAKNHECMPFSIGQIDPQRGFVHVFDDITLDIVLRTLDTISDFIAYLTKKEELYSHMKAILATGEEDLLAQYLKNVDSKGEHCFIPEKHNYIDAMFIEEGMWLDFSCHPSRLAQIEANKISYSWDMLIEKFLYHLATGTSYTLSHPSIKAQEETFRILASENRTRRRFLSGALHEIVDMTPPGHKASRLIKPCDDSHGHTHYLFLLVPKHENQSDIDYRQLRAMLLEKHLHVAKSDHPEIQQIVGLAFETGIPKGSSEDIMLLDTREWSADDIQRAEKIKQRLVKQGILSERKNKEYSVKEYPDIDTLF